MLSRKELYKKVLAKFDKKVSIDFWFEVLYYFYEKEKLEEKEVLSLFSEVNKNQT